MSPVSSFGSGLRVENCKSLIRWWWSPWLEVIGRLSLSLHWTWANSSSARFYTLHSIQHKSESECYDFQIVSMSTKIIPRWDSSLQRLVCNGHPITFLSRYHLEWREDYFQQFIFKNINNIWKRLKPRFATFEEQCMMISSFEFFQLMRILIEPLPMQQRRHHRHKINVRPYAFQSDLWSTI